MGKRRLTFPGVGNLTFSWLPSLISSYDLSFFPAAPMPHPDSHGLTLPGIGIFFLGGKFPGSGTHKHSNTIQWGPTIGGLMTHPLDCLQLSHRTAAVLIHCTVEKICCSGRVFDDNIVRKEFHQVCHKKFSCHARQLVEVLNLMVYFFDVFLHY